MNTPFEKLTVTTTTHTAIHPDVYKTIRDLFSGKDMETMQVLLPYVDNYVANPTETKIVGRDDLHYTLSNYIKLCGLTGKNRTRIANRIVKKLNSDLPHAWGRLETGESGVTKTEIYFTPQGFWTAFDYGTSPFAVKVRTLKNKIFNLAMMNLAKRSINYEAQIDQLQIKNKRTIGDLKRADADLEQAYIELEESSIELQQRNAELIETNEELEELNTAWVQTNQQLQEANNILELGISNIIIDTLNLPKRGGKLTAAGVRRLMSTIGRLATGNVIEKRGQFSNWVLRNNLTLVALQNIIRATTN